MVYMYIVFKMFALFFPDEKTCSRKFSQLIFQFKFYYGYILNYSLAYNFMHIYEYT